MPIAYGLPLPVVVTVASVMVRCAVCLKLSALVPAELGLKFPYATCYFNPAINIEEGWSLSAGGLLAASRRRTVVPLVTLTIDDIMNSLSLVIPKGTFTDCPTFALVKLPAPHVSVVLPLVIPQPVTVPTELTEWF